MIEKIRGILQSRNLCEIKACDLPAPETMKGVREVAVRLADAITNNESIALIGDYDVDGVSSVCIVELFLREVWESSPSKLRVKIPNRFIDGYGINEAMIKALDCDIFMTVDNGISAFGVANLCKDFGKTFIITDHHKPLIVAGHEELPDTPYIVNPNQSACNFAQSEVCGAVVAWYVCGGVKNELKRRGMRVASVNMRRWTKFLSLAIIADMMPLVAVNRTLYKLGVNEIARIVRNPAQGSDKSAEFAENEAFRILAQHYEINSESIGFFIAPLLNSPGRVGDAGIVREFFIGETPGNSAESGAIGGDTSADKPTNAPCDKEAIFQQLLEANNHRKSLQSEVLEQAIEILQSSEVWHFHAQDSARNASDSANLQESSSQNLVQILPDSTNAKAKSARDSHATASHNAPLNPRRFGIISDNLIVVCKDGFSEGVLGIVAAKLGDYFNKSAFVLTLDFTRNASDSTNTPSKIMQDSTGARVANAPAKRDSTHTTSHDSSAKQDAPIILKGSGRAREGINLIASVQFCKDYLLKFGGHSGAVGLGLEAHKAWDFIATFEAHCVRESGDFSDECVSVELGDLGEPLLELLESFEPFGVGNERLEFRVAGARVAGARPISDGKHQILSFEGADIRAMLFNDSHDFVGKSVDMRVSLRRDKMRGNAQCVVNDIEIVP